VRWRGFALYGLPAASTLTPARRLSPSR